MNSGGAAVTVWGQVTPTVAGVRWRTGKKRAHRLLWSLVPPWPSVLLCLVVYPCQPSLLPPVKHIIKSNYHVLQCHTRLHMYFDGMVWKVLRAVYLGSDPSAAVYVSDGFVLMLVFKHERSD